MTIMPKPTANDYPIDPLLQQRWSPLAFDPKPVPADVLGSLFEAARWSPSSSNEQPWRFLVGTRDGDPDTYEKLLDCIVPGNQVWATTAPVLFLVLATTTFARNGSENRFALYDAGQAVGHLTVEATALGLHLRQMGGFDAPKARQVFAIPDDITVGAMIALGYEGDPEYSTDEKYRQRHEDPTRTRKTLHEIVFTGSGDAFGTPSRRFCGNNSENKHTMPEPTTPDKAPSRRNARARLYASLDRQSDA